MHYKECPAVVAIQYELHYTGSLEVLAAQSKLHYTGCPAVLAVRYELHYTGSLAVLAAQSCTIQGVLRC